MMVTKPAEEIKGLLSEIYCSRYAYSLIFCSWISTSPEEFIHVQHGVLAVT